MLLDLNDCLSESFNFAVIAATDLTITINNAYSKKIIWITRSAFWYAPVLVCFVNWLCDHQFLVATSIADLSQLAWWIFHACVAEFHDVVEPSIALAVKFHYFFDAQVLIPQVF